MGLQAPNGRKGPPAAAPSVAGNSAMLVGSDSFGIGGLLFVTLLPLLASRLG
jgi:hypothetical protein